MGVPHVEPPDGLTWFREITEGTGVGVYPVMIGWKLPSARETLSQALDYYVGGAAAPRLGSEPRRLFFQRAATRPPTPVRTISARGVLADRLPTGPPG